MRLHKKSMYLSRWGNRVRMGSHLSQARERQREVNSMWGDSRCKVVCSGPLHPDRRCFPRSLGAACRAICVWGVWGMRQRLTRGSRPLPSAHAASPDGFPFPPDLPWLFHCFDGAPNQSSSAIAASAGASGPTLAPCGSRSARTNCRRRFCDLYIMVPTHRWRSSSSAFR